MDMSGGNTLLALEHRPVELGRIRLGAKATTKQGKEYPTTLDTWRLTSGQKGYLDAARELYGGTVEPWADAPDEGQWQLVTDSSQLRVLIPSSLRTVSQAYELWAGGTCERRCDGTTEQLSGGACLCDPVSRECELMTRISIMLPDVPGLGVWRLDTSGWHAATSLPATIELLKSLSSQPWIPAILRLEQRSKRVREPDGKVLTHRFAVPVLDLPNLTIGKVVSRLGNGEPVLIEAGERPTPPTAAERAIARAAAITAPGGSQPDVGADEPPHPAVMAAPTSGDAGAASPSDAGAPAPPGGDRGRSDARRGSTPAERDAAGGEAVTAAPPAPLAPCGAVVPEPDALGIGEGGPCVLSGAHRVHRNAAGSTWPVQ